MASPSAKTTPAFITALREKAKPFLTPYYLTVTVLLGAITAVFGVVILLLILVVTNFNLLGAIE